MRRWPTVALTFGLLAVFAAPATAAHHLMIVSEVALSEGGDASRQFVELVDPVDEGFPTPPYGISVFDGAGGSQVNQSIQPENVFATRDNTQPYLLATDASGSAGIRNQKLELALPAGSGQVCFWKNHNVNDRVNCLRYGTITGPVSAGTINQGPAPGSGQSLQVCGSSAAVAAPTPKAANCGGGGGGPGGGGAGGTTTDGRKPRATLAGRKTQDVDRLAVTVTLDEAGTVSATGTVRVPNSSKTYRFKRARKGATAGKRVKLRLKLSRKAKRAVKRSLRRGRKLRAKIVVTGVDGSKNRTTKRKTFRLKD